METYSVLMVFVRRIYRSPVKSLTKARRWSVYVFFDLHMNKWLSKQSKHRWFETPSLSLWRHCNDMVQCFILCVCALLRFGTVQVCPCYSALFNCHWRKMVIVAQVGPSKPLCKIFYRRFQNIQQHWFLANDHLILGCKSAKSLGAAAGYS